MSSSPWTERWDRVYGWFGRDDFNIAAYGTVLFTALVFWLPNVFFMLLDLTGRPHVLTQYKVQPGKNAPLSPPQLWKAVRMALFNQVFVGLPFSAALYYCMRWRGCSFGPENLPTSQRLALDFVVFAIVEEIGFYYLHRLLHHPLLYKHFHKQHHEWTAPIGVVAIYAHPVEHTTANLLPPVVGPLLMGSHLITLWAWFILVIVMTTIHHSGYHFPFFPSPEFHDFHHLKFNTCYGVLGVLDWFHGTDTLFRESGTIQRHKMLLSLTPMTKLVPTKPYKTS